MRSRYHYMTIWYQPTLGVDEAEPFGVLVEAHSDSQREVFGILRRMENRKSPVVGEILANFPEILRERLAAAADRATEDVPILNVLLRELQWNIFAQPATMDSDLPLRQVAYRLFAEHVDVDRAEVTSVRSDLERGTVDTQYTIDLVA